MNWYSGQDKTKSVREVVLDVMEPQPVDSKFGMLFLGTKYDVLRSSFWTAGFFRLESDPGPYLLLRADGYIDRLKNQPFRVAFCFYRMHAGGLIAVFVDFPKMKLPGVPSAPYVLLEMVRGLDLADERERIKGALGRSQLHICFAEGAGGTGSSINAHYDVLIDLDVECREALNREWKELLEYHDSMSSSRRNYESSVQQLQRENPLTYNPILDRREISESVPVPGGFASVGEIPTEREITAQAKLVSKGPSPLRNAKGRKWWQFWK